MGGACYVIEGHKICSRKVFSWSYVYTMEADGKSYLTASGGSAPG